MSEIDAIFSGKPAPSSLAAGVKDGKRKASDAPPKGSSGGGKRSGKDVEAKSSKAAKGKQKAEEPRVNGSTNASAAGEPPSKKRKKKPSVDEVFDPSAAVATAASGSSTQMKKRKGASAEASSSTDHRPSSSERGRRGLAKGRPYIAPASRGGPSEDDDAFADSRGAIADSKRKRTEEGFRILTEEELGLDRPDAGETDLCPFDCDCCKYTTTNLRGDPMLKAFLCVFSL